MRSDGQNGQNQEGRGCSCAGQQREVACWNQQGCCGVFVICWSFYTHHMTFKPDTAQHRHIKGSRKLFSYLQNESQKRVAVRRISYFLVFPFIFPYFSLFFFIFSSPFLIITRVHRLFSFFCFSPSFSHVFVIFPTLTYHF